MQIASMPCEMSTRHKATCEPMHRHRRAVDILADHHHGLVLELLKKDSETTGKLRVVAHGLFSL